MHVISYFSDLTMSNTELVQRKKKQNIEKHSIVTTYQMELVSFFHSFS